MRKGMVWGGEVFSNVEEAGGGFGLSPTGVCDTHCLRKPDYEDSKLSTALCADTAAQCLLIYLCARTHHAERSHARRVQTRAFHSKDTCFG